MSEVLSHDLSLQSPIVQLGYVVPDLESAMRHWIDVLGVGPFVVTPRIEYAQVSYKGQPIEIEISVALAMWRGMQIELIEQISGAPSMFTEFLARSGGGLHHLCVFCDDFLAELAAWSQKGISPLMQGRTVQGIDFAYLDCDPLDQGRVIEIVQPTVGLKRFFAKLEDLAANWDGSEAIRRL